MDGSISKEQIGGIHRVQTQVLQIRWITQLFMCRMPMPWPFVHGRACACRQKLNGSTPVKKDKRIPQRSILMEQQMASRKRHRFEPLIRINWVSFILQAMYGSGAQTVTSMKFMTNGNTRAFLRAHFTPVKVSTQMQWERILCVSSREVHSCAKPVIAWDICLTHGKMHLSMDLIFTLASESQETCHERTLLLLLLLRDYSEHYVGATHALGGWGNVRI